MTQFPEVSASRQDIRQLIRQRRRALSAEQQAQFAQQAAARMMAYPPVVMANTVALFLSFDGGGYPTAYRPGSGAPGKSLPAGSASL